MKFILSGVEGLQSLTRGYLQQLYFGEETADFWKGSFNGFTDTRRWNGLYPPLNEVIIFFSQSQGAIIKQKTNLKKLWDFKRFREKSHFLWLFN